jgi:hypothetical protein
LEARREQETQVVPFQSYMADIPRHASAMEQMERQSAARASYNRDALLPRIKWLEEWALRGVAGEPGFEPSWSRGQVSAAYLKKNGISHLWHFTDIRNLEHICRARGLLSYEGVEALVEPDSKVWRSSNEESVRRDRFLGRQDSVRLSYIPNSFFFQRVRFASDLVWMRFSLSALSFNEVFYSQGNAASEHTNLSLHPGALTIDWRLLAEYGGGSNISDPPFFYPKWHPTSFDDPEFVRYKKASINSEILIKHFLSLEFCTGVWDVNKECWIELNRY